MEHELVYVSEATREMSIADLTSLLEQSREKNARLGITGILVYHDKKFMQLLEGNRTDIFSLYETIYLDERNRQNHLLWDAPIANRSFADWSMAFITPSNLSLEGKPAYSSFLQSGLAQHVPGTQATAAKRLLHSFRDDFLKKK